MDTDRNDDGPPAPETVEDYITAMPSYDVAPRLVQMRATLRAALPDAEEVLSHGLPAYRQHGVVVVQFSGHDDWTALHVFPPGPVLTRFAEALQPHAVARTAIRFSLDEPLPTALVHDIAVFRLGEAAAYAARKRERR
ncbi:hypothetical protein HMPREF0063_11033 [Aeromicrobium marinum DSM 15272]|uniref:YdhG-like domain-containing protein n=1 Tax=Aeromicrobium marinum DSM 15272 TaxID=585531 RepID=E2S947_9ACTN|nr:DUF1801 domain-containing protein [Aeromicrobium marinum]EFQ84317.1 hypothetical protein HMPREF0063_11033 [Aeromicrobium marinum DSM 15272]